MLSTPAPALLEARDLTAELVGDAGTFRVLDDVRVALAPGDLVDVVGPSGAGKTTLLRALARLLPGASGELALEGVSAAHIDGGAWRLAVALLQQKPALIPGDVSANLLFPWRMRVRRGALPPNTGELRQTMDDFALEDVALNRDVARLSVGQQARIALLRLILTRPKVLLLDEPDAALDSRSAAIVADRLREFAEGGGAVLRVRHRESDGLAQRRLRLEGGALTPEVAS